MIKNGKWFLSWCGSAGKECACKAGDTGDSCLIPGLGRFPGEEKGYPLQHSDLENSIDSIVHVVTKSQTWLSNFDSLRGTLLAGARGEIFTEKTWKKKQGNYLTDCSLRPPYLGKLAGCLWLVLKFHILEFDCIDSGLVSVCC